MKRTRRIKNSSRLHNSAFVLSGWGNYYILKNKPFRHKLRRDSRAVIGIKTKRFKKYIQNIDCD